MVSTQLKNISQNWNLPQIGVNIKNIWNHHLDSVLQEWSLMKTLFFKSSLDFQGFPCSTPYPDRSPISGAVAACLSREVRHFNSWQPTGAPTMPRRRTQHVTTPKVFFLRPWTPLRDLIYDDPFIFGMANFQGLCYISREYHVCFHFFVASDFSLSDFHRLQPGGIPASNVSGDGPTTLWQQHRNPADLQQNNTWKTMSVRCHVGFLGG